jgi:hypothetical protein
MVMRRHRRIVAGLALAVTPAAGALVACGTVLGIDDRMPYPTEAGVDASPPTTADASIPDAGGPVDQGAPTPPSLVLSADSVDFGLSACGSTPANRTLTLTNLGGSPLTWKATLASSAQFSFTGAAAGVIAPSGGTAVITLASVPVPAFVSAGDTAKTVLTLETNDPDSAHAKQQIPIRLTAGGGTLALLPLAASFGAVPVGVDSPDIPLVLTNTGNLTIKVSLTKPSDDQFTLNWAEAPATVILPAGASVNALVARFKPKTGTTSTTSSDVAIVEGATCGVSPSAIAMTGTGSLASVGVGPGLLDFGLVDCGSQAAAKTFTITNAGGPTITWSSSPALQNYTLTQTGGTIAGGASATITVTPKAIPSTSSVKPDFFSETLTITTNATGDDPHTVELHETARGAILGASTNAVAFGSAVVGNTVNSCI